MPGIGHDLQQAGLASDPAEGGQLLRADCHARLWPISHRTGGAVARALWNARTAVLLTGLGSVLYTIQSDGYGMVRR
jgi:hypothetical protein